MMCAASPLNEIERAGINAVFGQLIHQQSAQRGIVRVYVECDRAEWSPQA